MAEGFDVVLMTGSSASGKSTFARRLAAAGPFALASQDVQGTQARCKAFVASELAKPGQKVVIDNTHHTGAVRKSYIDAARKARPGPASPSSGSRPRRRSASTSTASGATPTPPAQPASSPAP